MVLVEISLSMKIPLIRDVNTILAFASRGVVIEWRDLGRGRERSVTLSNKPCAIWYRIHPGSSALSCVLVETYEQQSRALLTRHRISSYKIRRTGFGGFNVGWLSRFCRANYYCNYRTNEPLIYQKTKNRKLIKNNCL